MWLPQSALLFCCLVAYADHSIQRPKELDVEIPETLENLEKTFPQGSDWMRLLKAERKFYYRISFLFILGDPNSARILLYQRLRDRRAGIGSESDPI